MRDRTEVRDGHAGMTELSSRRGEALLEASAAERLPVRCPSCDHANAAGSHYCNECGMPVHFEACGRCEAINRRGAASCHKCGCTLPGPAIPASAAAAHAIVATATSQPADHPDPSAGGPRDVVQDPSGERRNAMRAGLIALGLALVAVPAYVMMGQRTSSDATVDATAPRANATADSQKPLPPAPQAAEETVDAARVSAAPPPEPAPAAGAASKGVTGASPVPAAPPAAKGATRSSAAKSGATHSKQGTSSRKSSTRKPATKSP